MSKKAEARRRLSSGPWTAIDSGAADELERAIREVRDSWNRTFSERIKEIVEALDDRRTTKENSDDDVAKSPNDL